MNPQRFSGVRIACWALAGVTLSLSASPLRDAKRTVNGFSVDLAPLFKWWKERGGARPLPAWKHLTGGVVATNSGAWVIEAKLEGLPGKNAPAATSGAAPGSENVRVLLIHPPVEDAAEFHRLLDRFTQLNQRRATLASEKAQAHDRDQAVTRLERTTRRSPVQSRVLAAEDKHLKSVEMEAETQQKPIEEELREIKAKLADYPKPEEYVLDCFALELHSEYQGMPVYDHGTPSK